MQDWVDEAHARYRTDADGAVSTVYPALAEVPPDLFGICVAGTNGRTYTAGDAEHEFTIMSVSKPFVFALVCERIGPDAVRDAGRRQRHRAPVQLARGHRAQRRRPHQPDGQLRRDRHDEPRARRADEVEVHPRGLSRFAGRELPFDDEVYASASATNYRNQAIARLLHGRGRLDRDPSEAVDLYTRQCSLHVSAQRPRRDGRDAGRRRREPAHRASA